MPHTSLSWLIRKEKDPKMWQLPETVKGLITFSLWSEGSDHILEVEIKKG